MQLRRTCWGLGDDVVALWEPGDGKMLPEAVEHSDAVNEAL